MQKTKLTVFLMLIMIIGITVSCKKDKTKTELLTQKAWKPISFKDDGTEAIEACDKDDTYTFLTTGASGVFVGNFTKGTDDCSGTETDGPFTWSFTSGESKLVFDGDTATVSQLDGSTLKLTFTDGSDSEVDTYSH